MTAEDVRPDQLVDLARAIVKERKILPSSFVRAVIMSDGYVMTGRFDREGESRGDAYERVFNWKRLAHPNIMPVDTVLKPPSNDSPVIVCVSAVRLAPKHAKFVDYVKNVLNSTSQENEASFKTGRLRFYYLQWIKEVSSALEAMHRETVFYGCLDKTVIFISDAGSAIVAPCVVQLAATAPPATASPPTTPLPSPTVSSPPLTSVVSPPTSSPPPPTAPAPPLAVPALLPAAPSLATAARPTAATDMDSFRQLCRDLFKEMWNFDLTEPLRMIVDKAASLTALADELVNAKKECFMNQT
ncbi:hypothetical protein EIP91_002025 [Steccherinum ochraceum]|uniref:Protein kinase domain-containing protein n=1 Tax=Steccherinum ochraceum TaxID=92696 RepID=A0A4R0RCV1_9APHY|nr:hypothetical protein EIP91_002025 [Steccherinum ochraceum]